MTIGAAGAGVASLRLTGILGAVAWAFDFAWGHGGQFVVLLDELDMVVVVASDPFYLQHDDEAWRHERAIV